MRGLIKHSVLLFVFFSLFLSGFSFSDEPLPVPASYQRCSLNKKFCVKSKLNGDTVIFDNISKKPLWKIKGWHRNVFLSNDGKTLIVPYGRDSLIPEDYKPEMIMLHIWRSGKIKYRIRLSQLIKHFWRLKKTVSHYYWGEFLGFNETGQFMLKTVEHELVLIDVKSGKITRQ